jgi:hypothetical protein
MSLQSRFKKPQPPTSAVVQFSGSSLTAQDNYIPYSRPENIMVGEGIARLLRPDLSPEDGLAWVREKCRRRCSNAMPVRNVGRHLLFDWVLVSEWIRNSPRPVHASHKRRTKKQIGRAA